MNFYDIEFDYKQGEEYGSGKIGLFNDNEHHWFYFEFKAIQDYNCYDGCHSSTQEQPDEIYYYYDVIDEIIDFDKLIHKIEVVFEVENVKDEILEYIRDEFDKITEERYSHTIRG